MREEIMQMNTGRDLPDSISRIISDYEREESFDEIIESVGEHTLALHDEGYHCSEAIFRAVASKFLPDALKNETILRMVMPFRGGMAATMGSHCGGLTSGILIIGALYGRLSADEDAIIGPALARMYWKLFLDAFGTSHCTTLRKGEPTPEAPTRCGGIMVRSAQMQAAFLLDLQHVMPTKEFARTFRIDRSGEPCHEEIVPLLPID
jgi:C_GCAxxG_C_C family probable redox protein